MNIKDLLKVILKVIYSPVKAFESIAKKPDVKGPVIILVLILACIAIEQCAVASKIILADRTPANDEWAESVSLWDSNGNISLDDTINMFGDYSVRSMVSDSTSIWMNITNIGPLLCSGEEGYKGLSFWIRWTHQSGAVPNNFTLKLFSKNGSQYESDLTDIISESNGSWSMPMSGVSVGSDMWTPIGSPSWENITGLEFMLTWTNSAELTMNVDDLYFVKKPFSLLFSNSLNDNIITSLIYTVVTFFLTWIVYWGSFSVISWISHQKIGSWRMLFIATGYAFAIAIAGILVRAILYSSLPVLSFPLTSWPLSTYGDYVRVNTIMGHPLIILAKLGLDIWIVALCAVSIRALGGCSWKKAAIFAAFAYFIRLFFPIAIPII